MSQAIKESYIIFLLLRIFFVASVAKMFYYLYAIERRFCLIIVFFNLIVLIIHIKKEMV